LFKILLNVLIKKVFDLYLDMDKPNFSSNSAATESQSITVREPRRSRYSPWPIILLMLLMLICMGASASIIVLSNGQPVKSWTIAPAVLLAFISSIWNFAAASMLGTAVTITWWRSFLQGTTVRNLHYIWRRGAGLSWFSSFRAGVDARNIVLLASLVVIVQTINNPLLQRSTHVEAKEVIAEDTLMLNMVSQLPDGRVAVISNATSAATIGLPEGIAVAQAWFFNDTMLTRNTTGFQCDGICRGSVQATGLRFTCNSSTESLDLLASQSIGSTVFSMDTNLIFDATGAPNAVFIAQYASAVNTSCIATITVDTCTFESGLVQYPIVIQGNTIALDQAMLDNMTFVSNYTSAGDLATAAVGQGAGPLQSMNDWFGYLHLNSVLQVDPVGNNSIYSGGLYADLFFKTNDSDYDPSILHKCGLSFHSPTTYALHYMHEFMFRASFMASTDADNQTIPVQRSNSQLVFRSNYHCLAAVLAAMLMALLCLFSQVWAWWELGWNVTMSPIETASSFGAPVLQQEGGRSAQEILKIAGTRIVVDSRTAPMQTSTMSSFHR